MIYLELFLNFLWVGAFTFGGGYGGIPLIREVVISHGWLTDETLSYMIAVSESTPGPVMVNLATYVGYDQAGILGAIIATTAEVFPAFAIIILIMSILKMAMKNPTVKAVLAGMQPCAVGIILATGIYMTLSACAPDWAVDVKALVIGAVLVFLSNWGKKMFKLKKKLSTLHLIAISAIMGIVLYGI